jgi:hypothetical protein
MRLRSKSGGTGARIENAPVLGPRKAYAINAGEPPPKSPSRCVDQGMRNRDVRRRLAPSVYQYGFGKRLWLFRF